MLLGALEGEQQLRTAQNLLIDPALTHTTIYFTHYLFETYRLLAQPAAFFARLGLWFDLAAQGFKTTPEQPEPARSITSLPPCCAPARPPFGFDEVEIAPMPGHLTHLAGELVHPQGRIVADLHFAAGQVRGTVSLPVGLHGAFYYAGKTVAVQAGAQSIAI